MFFLFICMLWMRGILYLALIRNKEKKTSNKSVELRSSYAKQRIGYALLSLIQRTISFCHCSPPWWQTEMISYSLFRCAQYLRLLVNRLVDIGNGTICSSVLRKR